MRDSIALEPRSLGARARREARAALELWLLPALVAILPYRAGIALARALARWERLYAGAAEAGGRCWREVAGEGDAAAWRRDYRFAQIVDHADLYWALTRSRAFLARRLGRVPVSPDASRPLLVVSFHYGQGLWLLHWLASAGRAPRFVSIRLAREPGDALLAALYARLRIATVARLAGAEPIYTGGARREIAATLDAGGTVYGLVDVPVPDAGHLPPNATMLGRPVLLPAGIVESATDSRAAGLVLTSRVAPDGSRVVEAEPFDDARAMTPDRLGHALAGRLARAPASWHFWHLWRTFERASPGGR